MNSKNRRAMTWILVALGIALVGLGIVLVVTAPASAAGAFPFPGFWSRGPDGSEAAAAAADASGFQHWFSRGPWLMPARMFGGGFMCIGMLVLFFFLISRRWKGHVPGWRGRCGSDDAVEILRRSLAEGKITEEEYKSRLKALEE
jgi:uncharacterized membrane protein